MTTGSDPLDDDAIRSFARSFERISGAVHRLVGPEDHDTTVDRIVGEFVGVDPATLPSVGEDLSPVERPNLQLALDDLTGQNPDHRLVGLSPEIVNYGGFSLSAVLAGRFHGESRVVPPVYEDVAVGVDRHLRCVVAGLWLLRLDGDPVVIGVAPQRDRGYRSTPLRVEVFAPEPARAAAVLEELGRLRDGHDVYRGAVLGFPIR